MLWNSLTDTSKSLSETFGCLEGFQPVVSRFIARNGSIEGFDVDW